MKSRIARVLIVIGSVAAAAGAMVAIAHHLDSPQPAAKSSIAISTTPEPADRFGFVSARSFAMLLMRPTEEPRQPSGSVNSEPSPSWSVETQREAAAPANVTSFSLFGPERLPWLSRKPGTVLRPYTLKERLAELAAATWRLAEKFENAKAHWPPAEIALVAIKDEKVMELFARPAGGTWKFVHRYKVLAASGKVGPKLRQGDRQVPEGVYSIALLNPNSQYHVSMRVNYPNAFDKQMAAQDGRKDLGGDIMIHGKNLSAGCLAVGDAAAEELFVLAAQTGLAHVKLIIAPTDFRQNAPPAADPTQPVWVPKLYTEVAIAMSDLKPPPTPKIGLMSLFGN